MNISFLGGLTFVLVFAGMIMIHEMGHFLVARLCKIEIEEFGIGFPPRIATLFTWKGTRFTLNWIPLGGFVRPKGENDPSVKGGLAAAKPWARVSVLFAGPLMNLLAAVIAYSLLFTQIGIPDRYTAMIVDVSPDSPAELAGLQVSDIVLSAASQHVIGTTQLITITQQNLGQQINLTILRGDEIVETSITPRADPPAGEGPMGVIVGSPLIPSRSWITTFSMGVWATNEDISNLLSIPGRIILGTAAPQELNIGGPRSVWNLFQAAVARDFESRQPDPTGEMQVPPTYFTLLIIIALNVSLGTINLLPIPALDGGRILLSLPELLFRKRISPKFESVVHGIGFTLLLALFVTFYIKDFINPLTINLH